MSLVKIDRGNHDYNIVEEGTTKVVFFGVLFVNSRSVLQDLEQQKIMSVTRDN